MMKKTMLASWSVALALGSATVLFGHGGAYRGPSGTVPPNLGGTGDTTPPGNPGGPGSPVPGGPTTGGRGTPGPTAAPTAGRTNQGSGLIRRRSSEGFERWEFWWEHNKEPFLNLKNRLDLRVVFSGSAAHLLGREKTRNVVVSNRPKASEIKNHIRPELIALLSESRADVVDSAVLALARMIKAEDAHLVLEPIVNTLRHPEKSARESATLALGVLGSPEAYDVLLSLLLDGPEGRRLCGRSSGVETMVRAFAAASLGLIGDVRAIPHLQMLIDDDRLSAKRDIKVMAVQALGLMPWDTSESVVSYLTGLMQRRGMSRIIRAQAPIALGRLYRQGDSRSETTRAALSQVVGLFENDKTDNQLRRSLALCMGMLAQVEDREAIAALRQGTEARDAQTRSFSLMALARIGQRDVKPAEHAEVHQELEHLLLQQLVRPRPVTNRPWGALALGVYARNEAFDDVGPRVAAKIRETFADTRNPSYRGAMAIALGLLNDPLAAPDLWEEFGETNDQALRGYIAVSLGLMRETARSEMFRALLRKKGLEAQLRLQLARALGLMGDADAVDTLVSQLQDAPTIGDSSSSAAALGLIGDRGAVDTLLDIARDPKKRDLHRGFAAVALGIIAEKSDLPWNTVFTVDSNYRAKVNALSEIFDIL